MSKCKCCCLCGVPPEARGIIESAPDGVLLDKDSLMFSQIKERQCDGVVISDSCHFWGDAKTNNRRYFVTWAQLVENFRVADFERDTRTLARTSLSGYSAYYPDGVGSFGWIKYRPYGERFTKLPAADGMFRPGLWSLSC